MLEKCCVTSYLGGGVHSPRLDILFMQQQMS